MTTHRLVHSASQRVRTRGEGFVATRQARAFARRNPACVRVCWNLDNTLVDSGTLLGRGVALHDAVRTAEPLAGMLEFQRAIREELPQSVHFVLSSRARTMQSDMVAWLRRHAVGVPEAAVCLVPSPELKPAVWRQLARRARLVVVDDLSWGHETEGVRSYARLVARAEQVADVYVGLATIADIAAEPARARSVAASVAAAVTAADRASAEAR